MKIERRAKDVPACDAVGAVEFEQCVGEEAAEAAGETDGEVEVGEAAGLFFWRVECAVLVSVFRESRLGVDTYVSVMASAGYIPDSKRPMSKREA